MTQMAVQLDPESLVARIIAELQANPEAQQMLLRALLTNEFLGMPARLDRIEADIAEIKTSIERLDTRVGRLETSVGRLETSIERLDTRVGRLETSVGRLEINVAHLRGDMLEVRIERRVRPLLSQRLGLRRSRIMLSPALDSDTDFDDAIERALRGGAITSAQEARVYATDFILRAQRITDGSSVWAAIEVSNTINHYDVDRARETAEILGIVFGTESIAVAMGYSIAPQDQQRAEDDGVHALLVDDGRSP